VTSKGTTSVQPSNPSPIIRAIIDPMPSCIMGDLTAARLLRLERGCRNAHDLAAAKLIVVERRLADLRRIRRTLSQLIGRCEQGGAQSCPIIDTLES
jgi:hypothetical protein